MLRVRRMKLLNKKECSMDLSKGDWVQITGSNGVGKSLLLKSLARLIPSEWNELTLNGKDSKDYSIEQWRSNLLYVPPEVVFDSDLTVEEFLDEPFQMTRYKNFKKSFDPKTHWENLSASMGALSSGQKQQVALLRALSLDAKILLLDEPFGHMDVARRNYFLELLMNWSTEEKALILVSHVELEKVSGRLRQLNI